MHSLIHSWTDGYLAVRARAFETRGGIELDTGMRWPRTTGEDVVAIAALFDHSVRAHASPGVVNRWLVTLADLEAVALAAPHATYAENRTFWATIEMVAVFLDDLAVEPPPQPLWDALIDHLAEHVHRNVGPSGDGPFKHFDNVKTFDDLYLEQFKYLRDLRGFDKVKAEAGQAGGERNIPRSTNTDVVALTDYWSKQLDAAKSVMGHDDTVKHWNAVRADIDQIARKGDPNAVYTKNNEFWRELSNTAIYVAVADESPSKWDLAKESIKDSITHLPETLEHAASKGADLVASAAHAVGKVANEAGKGLFAGFGTPLLIGAGLIGLFLITRSRDHEEA
jgi:hypothetical protein